MRITGLSSMLPFYFATIYIRADYHAVYSTIYSNYHESSRLCFNNDDSDLMPDLSRYRRFSLFQ
ncbi:hypothetical protein An05g01310 [Aspergillus niger]|uniref:Uncharacterized protein n=2 Tax=Aspergillus niger TaxID=5061 RepID=A2QKT3_ASPNC|nr:hypothetical protein An05g01310 [Aspergillus niger]CAK96470.1 hypothetical protein An05g01310 [Aspergillus niger]